MNESPTKSPTILVVDDDPDHVALVASTLRRAGFEVLTAMRAEEALDLAAARPPDAAVLDVMMEHLAQGFDLARALRRTHPSRHLPVLFLSGLDRVYDLESQIGEDWLPGERLLHKPVSTGELLKAVRDLLASRAVPDTQGER